MPTDWREWLESIRSGELEQCNLFLLSKMVSATPDILDAENRTLKRAVYRSPSEMIGEIYDVR
jgi:hypothetical protein